MQTAAKVGIGCLIAAVLGALLLAGAGYFFWKNYGEGMIEAAKQTADEGQAFGRASDEWRCVNETLGRYRNERGMTSAIKARIFLKSCLETSRGAAGFCDGVPARTEFTRTVAWRQEKCEQANLSGDQFCPQFFEEVQQYCNGDGRNKSRPAAPSGDDAPPPTPAPRRTTTRRP